MTNIWSTTHDQPSYTGRGRVREGGREGGRERQREGGRERHTHYAETARKHGRFLKWQHPCRRAGQCAPVFSSVCLSECACYMNIPRWPLPRPQAPPNAARSLTPGPPAYRSPCPWDPPLYHLPEMLRRYRPQHATAARDLVQARLRGYNRTAPVHVYMIVFSCSARRRRTLEASAAPRSHTHLLSSECLFAPTSLTRPRFAAGRLPFCLGASLSNTMAAQLLLPAHSFITGPAPLTRPARPPCPKRRSVTTAPLIAEPVARAPNRP